jgi:hypothetical protein
MILIALPFFKKYRPEDDNQKATEIDEENNNKSIDEQ